MANNKNATQGYVDNQNVSVIEHVKEVFKEYKEVVNARFDRVDTRLAASDKAIEVAEKANQVHLATLNEFRATVEDLIKQYPTRVELNGLRDLLRLEIDKQCELVKKQGEEIESLKLSRAELAGKASQTQVIIALVISLIGVVLSLIDWFTK